MGKVIQESCFINQIKGSKDIELLFYDCWRPPQRPQVKVIVYSCVCYQNEGRIYPSFC